MIHDLARAEINSNNSKIAEAVPHAVHAGGVEIVDYLQSN